MLANYIKIVFDHEDRTYCTEEPVSGKVIVEASTDICCQEIWISYEWRTHGSGNPDSGGVEALVLANESIKFQKGEHKEFPFRFNAPTGPVTYHGYYVNVDWYLKAFASLQGAHNLETEEDFLLTGRESPGNDGTQSNFVTSLSAPNKATSSSYGQFLIVIGGIFLIFLGAMFLLVSFFLRISSGFTFLAFLILIIGLWMLLRNMISNLVFKLKINIEEVKVEPEDLHPGDQVRCKIKFQTKGAVYLDQITALILAEETAKSGSGSSTSTLSYTLYQKQHTKLYGEEMEAGRWISYEGPLPIPAYAPPTFDTGSNSIHWSVRLKISCKRWPSWEKTLPVTVSVREIPTTG